MPGQGRIVVLGGTPLATYRFTTWIKALFVGLALVFCAAGAIGMMWVWFWQKKADPMLLSWLLGPFAAGFAALGIAAAVSALQGSLVLYGDYLIYTGWRRRLVRRDHILRTRRPRQAYGMFSVILDLKGIPKRKVRISAFGPLDDVLADWLDEFPNAEWDAQVERDEKLLANPVWGRTPQDRERNINRDAERLNWLYWPGWALMIWAFAFPQPYEVCLSALLVLPMIALIMVLASQGRWSLLEDVDSGRLEIGTRLFFLPCGALALRALLDHNLVDWVTPVIYGIGIGGLLTALTGLIERRLSVPTALGLLVLWSGYAWGGMLFVDTRFDPSPGKPIPVRIVGMSESSHDHTLSVTAWGKKPDDNDIKVSARFYGKLHKGDQICVYVYPGLLNWSWYEAGRCQVKR